MSQPPRKLVHLPKVRMLSRGPRAPCGIRITHVKSIKPPDPETVKKTEEEKLRAQLQKEIVSRSRACAYKGYECTLPVVSGRQYCFSHITRDPTAPYRQCAHAYSDGERCQEPAPKEREHRDQSLCFEHARAALHSRHRASAPPPPVATTETMLNQLQHYVRPERPRTTSCASSVSVVSDPADQDQTSPTPIDPFKQIDAPAQNSAHSAAILECHSASDSDCDDVTLDAGLRDCSGDEEAPCELRPLWRAGVFTAEEAVCEARNTLKSLQSAYIRQMGRLRTLLQTARRQYLYALKVEKEQYCSINSQAGTGPLSARERRQLRQLKAFASYRRPLGVGAVLARKLSHKRAKRDNNPRNASIGRCIFTDDVVRCTHHALPAAKYCYKHILHDSQQVLFSACGDSRGLSVCGEPIPKLPLPSSSCRYHTNPPVYTAFTLKKDESDSETESRSSLDSHDIREIEDNGSAAASESYE
ncbi:KAT8 regulatory NSL complex subunit 2 [Amyelois transitella]|uniref:KAT8 regulatory NSL complex subunit 2 n=1 Tax=Amyelois transitella TaxID=680683 RepID=UPI00067AD9E7|nr:KAT8 regulatory NSL complex subunit 2 [Amyelois transitella]